MVPWGPKHVVATEINQLSRGILVFCLIKYCYVDSQNFSVNCGTQQDAYNEGFINYFHQHFVYN
jgi:hypothetical protein